MYNGIKVAFERLMDTGRQAPQQEIRRFDIFAEWNRLKARTQQRFSDADAQAYGLAVAKIVAARKFAGHRPERVRDWKRRATREDFTEAWWTHLGSAAEFNDKIVTRMGKSFYRRVFQPAVRRAWKEGQRYEQIRDALRAPWNATFTRKPSQRVPRIDRSDTGRQVALQPRLSDRGRPQGDEVKDKKTKRTTLHSELS